MSVAVLEQLMKNAADARVSKRNRSIPRVYLNEFEVEQMTGIPVSKLRKDRSARTGIAYIPFPRCIRYSVEDVIAYMEAHRINPEDRPFNPEGRIGRPRKDGSAPNAATGIGRSAANRKETAQAGK
jgi:hypothetical protein